MAVKTITILEDDLTGEELGDSGGRNVLFGLHGKTYEIDLAHTRADEFEDYVGKFAKAARRVLAPTSSTPRKTARGAGTGKLTDAGATVAGTARHSREYLAAVREWAANKGEPVSSFGRIPAKVLDAYAAEHGTDEHGSDEHGESAVTAA